MALTTLAAVEAAIQYPWFWAKQKGSGVTGGVPTDFWSQTGFPQNAAISSSGLAGAALTAPLLGSIPFLNPVSGNTYVARLTGAISGGSGQSGIGLIILYDRLWDNSGVDITTTNAQTINSAAWPARDANGATSGEGVFIAIENTSTITGAGSTVTFSMSYTNSGGTSGQTGVGITQAAWVASAAGNAYPIGLASGDTGVQSIQTITLSATSTSGNVCLFAYRPIAVLQVPTTGTSGCIDAITGVFPKIINSSVLSFLTWSNGINSIQVSGQLQLAQG